MLFRALALDGVGFWALTGVRALTTLYGNGATGHQALRNFDPSRPAAGRSFVLVRLVDDLPFEETPQRFTDENTRCAIFSPTPSLTDEMLESTVGIGPKYCAVANSLGLLSKKPGAVQTLKLQSCRSSLAGEE